MKRNIFLIIGISLLLSTSVSAQESPIETDQVAEAKKEDDKAVLLKSIAEERQVLIKEYQNQKKALDNSLQEKLKIINEIDTEEEQKETRREIFKEINAKRRELQQAQQSKMRELMARENKAKGRKERPTVVNTFVGSDYEGMTPKQQRMRYNYRQRVHRIKREGELMRRDRRADYLRELRARQYKESLEESKLPKKIKQSSRKNTRIETIQERKRAEKQNEFLERIGQKGLDPQSQSPTSAFQGLTSGSNPNQSSPKGSPSGSPKGSMR